MKQPSYKGFAPLSDAVIDAACAGDVDAIDRILRHYDGYINKLCVRKYIDGSGDVHYDVDEYMKRRLQIKLIHSIVVKCLYFFLSTFSLTRRPQAAP